MTERERLAEVLSEQSASDAVIAWLMQLTSWVRAGAPAAEVAPPSAESLEADRIDAQVTAAIRAGVERSSKAPS